MNRTFGLGMMKNHHRMWLSVRVSLYPPVAVDSIWRLISFSDPQPPHQPHHLLLTKYRKFDAMKLLRRHGFGSSLSWSLHYSSSEPIGKPSEPILQSIGFEFPIGTAIGAFHPSSSGRNRWRRSSCLQPHIRQYSFTNKIATSANFDFVEIGIRYRVDLEPELASIRSDQSPTPQLIGCDDTPLAILYHNIQSATNVCITTLAQTARPA